MANIKKKIRIINEVPSVKIILNLVCGTVI